MKVGDRVSAQDVVAETSLPGNVNPINLANTMSLPPADVMSCMLKSEGDPISIDEPLAQTKGIFGRFKNVVKSRFEGTVETVSPVTGQVIIRGAPTAGAGSRLHRAAEVVLVSRSTRDVKSRPTWPTCRASSVSVVKPRARIRVVTRLRCARPGTHRGPASLPRTWPGCVVVGGARMTVGVDSQKALEVKRCRHHFRGHSTTRTSSELLGYDLGVAITGRESNLESPSSSPRDLVKSPWPIGPTRCFARFMKVARGIGQWRHPDPGWCHATGDHHSTWIGGAPAASSAQRSSRKGSLEIGAHRFESSVIPWFGMIGEVSGLPAEPHVLGSGSKARVLEVTFPSGEKAIVPRANVELIEE